MKYITYLFFFCATTMLNAQTNEELYRLQNDWANLARYRADNAVLAAPEKTEKRVVMMGNSITEGWSRAMPTYFEQKRYINRGISGQTTPQMLVRFRPDVVHLQPTVVVLLCGINDIAGNTGASTVDMICDNIASMCEIAQANGIKVVLCSVLPANRFPWRPAVHPADSVIELNARLRQYAEKQHLEYLDYYSAMVDAEKGLRAELGDDGVHPNEKGYAIMQTLLEKTLVKVLK